MRSRRDDVDHGRAVERALSHGLCGIGGRLAGDPGALVDALVQVASAYGERSARRLERFAAVERGSFVWTRDVDGHHLLGRLEGEWRYDDDPEAVALDLVHVRDCLWRPDPVPFERVPPAVLHTYARGGRNFQQIHDAAVTGQSASLWS